MVARVLPAILRASLIISVALGFATVAARSAEAQSNRGAIKGVVLDSLGAVVGFAEITIVGSGTRTIADAVGAFRLANVPFGEVDLRVRRLGYRPSVSTVVFPAGTEPFVELRIAAVPDYLPNVEVVAERDVSDARLAGFRARSTKGVGHFVTRERLERLHSYRFTDVLREVPGVRMRTLRGGGTTISLRGASCSPIVFVDGSPASAGTVDLDMFDLNSVDGIEIYHGMASVPAEFVTGRGLERCGVVAIWSRPYRAKVRPVVAEANRSRELEGLVESMTVYTIDQVDNPASLIAGTVAPEFPDSLRAAGVSGRVVVQLVVNADGTLDADSPTLISSTHPLFTESVQQALATARFQAATLNVRPVRQVLQLPFAFRLDESALSR
ncbi:MAG: TonB family protein [Gemmatimonadaceae bacterium]|nr:TonB family protein [Gemmatimonadaceae bacterium]